MRFLVLLYVILITQFSFGQKAYYVSNDGNNGNNGGLAAPYKTIQFGMDQLTPGDTLLIRAGEYAESCRLQVAGSMSKPVVIQAYNNERVVIAGNPEEEGATISLFELQHVVIRGLEISGNESGPGIYLDQCTDILIDGNMIHGNSAGIQVENSNLAHAKDNITIRNNFIYRNAGNGLIVGPEDMDSSGGLIEGLLVRNNSFFENDTEQQDRGEIRVSNANNSRFINNIFYSNQQSLVGEVHEFFYSLGFDYNTWYSILGQESIQIYWNGTAINGFENFKFETGKETNGLFANPLFLSVSADAPDLHLTPNSPVIGKADPDTVFDPDERDIDGQTRVRGLPDIGADEYYLQLIICSMGIFEATPDDELIRLSWSGTCFSVTGGRYLVQRSRDRENWETIGEVISQASKFNTEVFYEYFDTSPLEGLSFYRTRFVDENGSYLDSNVDQVVFTSGEVLVFPNPVEEVLNIIVDDDQEIEKVRMVDAAGKWVGDRVFSTTISMQNLPAGKYVLELLDERGERVELVQLLRL